MVSHCLKTGTEFVVVLLREDLEASDEFYRVGTLAKVVDFSRGECDGFLAIIIEGITRVDLSLVVQQEDGLWLADAVISNEEDFVPLPEQFNELRIVLEALVQHPFVHNLNMDIDFYDGRQVGWRLTELLPMDNRQKQLLFELKDPIQRLSELSDQISLMMI
jgi:Lon protease-like protein